MADATSGHNQAAYDRIAALYAERQGSRSANRAARPRRIQRYVGNGRSHIPPLGQNPGPRRLAGGFPLALILAEPVLGAHPERHILAARVRVAGDVPVTAVGTEVAPG